MNCLLKNFQIFKQEFYQKDPSGSFFSYGRKMNFDLKKIKYSLDTAQNLRATYFAYFHGVKTYICVNDLLKMARTNLNKTIVLSFLDASYKEHSMNSFVHIEDDESYEICLLSGMTNCWNRFSLCKEIFHVVLDTEAARNPLIYSHLADYKASLMDLNIDGSEASHMEILAEFAAMQFLFPYAKRLDCLLEIDVRKNEPVKNVYLDFAVRFRLPRLMIEDYLSPRMIDFFDPISWIEKSDKR